MQLPSALKLKFVNDPVTCHGGDHEVEVVDQDRNGEGSAIKNAEWYDEQDLKSCQWERGFCHYCNMLRVIGEWFSIRSVPPWNSGDDHEPV